ncbi:MAG: phage portal protein [Prevotella sp.]|jgi:HK97 family phage portal protein|nr:phage portal protein [Prevotella sp.]MCH3994866.1 phage portal protein [Prevotella sp.]
MIQFKKLFGPFYRKVQRSADQAVQITGDTSVFQPDYDGFSTRYSMNIAAVYRCVSIKASAIAGMGLHFMRSQTQTVNNITHKTFVPTDNMADYLLSMQPNIYMSAYDLLDNLVTMLDLQGNAYILPTYSGGELIRLILLAPGTVSYDINTKIYHINDYINGIHDDVKDIDIIHIRNRCLDGGFCGVSTLHFAANTLGIAYKTDRQQSDMFQSGSTLRGFISGDGDVVQGYGAIQDTQLSTVGNRIETELKSGKRIFTLPGIMRFNQLSMSPADMQLLDSKKFSVEEICRFFGVPPDKVFHYTSTNYKSAENSQTTFMTDTLMPLMRKIENELNIKLIGFANMRNYRIKFSLDNYYESDPTAKADYYQKCIQSGILTPNEIRAKEGLQPVDGGDTTFISCNVAPIDSPKISGTLPDQTQPTQQNEGAKTSDDE